MLTKQLQSWLLLYPKPISNHTKKEKQQNKTDIEPQPQTIRRRKAKQTQGSEPILANALSGNSVLCW